MRYLSILSCLLLLLVSCNGGKKKLNNQVKQLEEQVKKNFSKEKASELLVSYDKFIVSFPDDTACKGYMVNGAEISLLEQDPNNALKFINQFLKTYPDDPRAGQMQFKKALVYDLLVHDGLRAAAEYDIFIKKYPTHPWRKDAENAILLIQDPGAFLTNIQNQQDTGLVKNENQ